MSGLHFFWVSRLTTRGGVGQYDYQYRRPQVVYLEIYTRLVATFQVNWIMVLKLLEYSIMKDDKVVVTQMF